MLWAYLLLAIATVASAGKVLVLVENLGAKDTHSIFLQSLKERGHQVFVRTADDSSLNLQKYGELVYDHLILFAPSVDEFGGTVNVKEIASFVDAGGNVIVTGGANLGEAIRELAIEHGFEFDETDTAVIDHKNYDALLDDGFHTTIVAGKDQLIKSNLIVGETKNLNPILYKGSALVAGKNNHLRLEVLHASPSAYSYKPAEPLMRNPSIAGKHAILVGAVQTRNNARVVFTGSLEMFSNKFINAQVHKAGLTEKPVPSGNLALVTDLSKWALKETGVLRVKKVTHHLAGKNIVPTEYTITDEVEYIIEIEEFKNGKWEPFQGKDVQLEFVRIDPFVRTVLQNKNGRLSIKFTLPDVYGVFKFLVDYRRVGYSHLHDVQQVSVRPLLHTQYERFIPSAYPYYASSFSMMAGLVLFSIVFLHFKEPAKVSTAAKNK
ncbi:unnamed protein product [Auanema sp. JU1783]|nr:unnamed protein product [Auanema sp. JU1783]